MSILLQYRRIFIPSRKTSPVIYFGVWSVFWSNIIFYVTVTFIQVFFCNPREGIWNKLVPAKCFDTNAILISIATFNLVSDVIILILPQHVIWKLHMGRRRKLGLSAIFGLGGLYVSRLLFPPR